MNMDDHNYRVKRALAQLLDDEMARNDAASAHSWVPRDLLLSRWLAMHQLTADDIEECRMTVLRGESHDEH